MRTSACAVVIAFLAITACAQLQGLDGYEKVDCLDNCNEVPPQVDATAPPGEDASTMIDSAPPPDGAKPPCENGVKDEGEGDIDCGGTCATKCALGKGCIKVEDCDTADGGGIICTSNTCSLPFCINNVKDPTETDVDCGGSSCPKCALGKTCGVDTDCLSNACFTTCIDKPVLSSLAPSYAGTNANNLLVTLSGTGFVDKGGWTVSFGGTNTTHAFVSSTTLQANVPNGTAGKVDVSVVGMPGGTMTLPQAFLYVNLDINFAAATNVDANSGGIASAVGDFTGDGKLDILWDHSGTHWHWNQNNSVAGSISVSQLSTGTPSGAPSAALVDVNGDNRADLLHVGPGNVFSVRLWNPTPDGGSATFDPPVTYTTGASAAGLAMGDFNGDNKVDAAVLANGADEISILLGNGGATGTFNAATAIACPRGTRIVTADLNGDGKRDLVTSSSQNMQVNVLLGSGTGTFSAPVAYALGATSEAVALGDVDGDAKVDIVVSNGGKISVLRGNGNGTFNARVDTTIPNAVSIPNIAVADLNGDGRADVAFADVANAAIGIWVSGTGGALLDSAKGFTAITSPYGIHLTDFDGDGKLDIYYTSALQPQIRRRL